MARKQIRLSRRMLFTWFMLGGFIFLFAPQRLTNKFQFAFARIFRWPLTIGRSVSLSARTQQSLTDVVSRREYIQIQNHLANVEAQLAQELQRNQKLSGFHKKHPLSGAKFVFANIIEASVNELMINCGGKDGLVPGQFVLADNSIIGTVSEVSSRTAKVKLITSPTSQIAVRIAGLDIDRVMLQGNGKNSAKIPLLSAVHKVKIGDKVLAGNKQGLLDTPIIVGTVAQCQEDEEHPLIWDITVEPACDIERISYVDVIVMNPPE